MAHYQIKIRQKDGTELGEFDVWDSLRFEKRLNRPGTAEISVPATDDKLSELTSLRNYEMVIARDGTTVWAGELANRLGDLSANEPNWVTLSAYDFIELFNHRFTDARRAFESTDAGQIAWTLIDESQNNTDGDYGVTQGTIEATKDRDKEYSNKNVMQAIIQLSELIGGFDFEITDSKVFNVYAKKGSDLSRSVVFEWGTNIETATIDEDFTKPVNQAIALGAGLGSSQLRRVRTDTDARSVHKLRQARISATDVSENDTLDDKADAVIAQFKQPVLNIGMKQIPGTQPSFGALSLGDRARVKIQEGVYEIDNDFRVYGYEVKVDREGVSRISYDLSIQ